MPGVCVQRAYDYIIFLLPVFLSGLANLLSLIHNRNVALGAGVHKYYRLRQAILSDLLIYLEFLNYLYNCDSVSISFDLSNIFFIRPS